MELNKSKIYDEQAQDTTTRKFPLHHTLEL